MLTIITPTYNRAGTLPACYESLAAQTCKQFIWMIVDDGSKDNTEQLVSGWMKENTISIQYLYKENGGKASALNLAFENLMTEYACCLDSDDTFYPDAVRIALEQLEQVREDDNCCGLLALRNNPDGTVMGGKEIPQDQKTITAVQLHMNYDTELICFYKTSLLKQYRFPQFEGEKFVSPAWLEYEIGRRHYFLASREKFCCCEYIADGITRNKRKIIVKNPRGYTCVKRQSFEFASTVKATVKHGIMYNCGCIIGKDPDWFHNAPKKGWALILRPAAWAVYWIRFRKLRIEHH